MALATVNDVSCPMSCWQLLGRLLQGDLYPAGKSLWHRPEYRCKFAARAMIHPVLTLRWLSYITQHPCGTQLLRAQMTLPNKLQRPYLSVRFRPRHRFAALCFHYDEIRRTLSPRLRTALLAPTGVPVIQLQGKHGNGYSVMLGSFSALDKEGEVTLQFCTEDGGAALTRLTMTLMCFDGQKTLFIGGLQGPGRHLEQQRERIQQVTRECHGLFPKRIVMEAASCLAQLLGATQLLAVGNQTHIYHSLRYWRKKKLQFHADYDGFWEMLGGQQRADGYYQLPLQLARKPLDEVASKKRAEYQRATALLVDVHQQMQQLIQV